MPLVFEKKNEIYTEICIWVYLSTHLGWVLNGEDLSSKFPNLKGISQFLTKKMKKERKETNKAKYSSYMPPINRSHPCHPCELKQ